MCNSTTLLDFYKNCQQRLKLIMASQNSQFLGYDASTKTLTRLDSTQNLLIKDQPLSGLIEKCIEKRHIVEVAEPTREISYNPSLDLMTDLSLLTVPIIDHESQNVIGVFQVINLVNDVERSYEKINWIDKEVVDFLCEIIEKCLKRFK